MIAQQPPATGALAHFAQTVTTTGAKILDGIPQGQSPRLWLCLSNASDSSGVWIRFDGQTGAAGVYIAPGAGILLTWPHCPQGEVTATAAADTVTVGIVEGR